MTTNYDHLNAMIEWEQGNLDQEETIELFQHLIDTGIIYHLQGTYQRAAQALVDADLCHE